MNLNKLLKVSTLAGKIMLESGAETYRVEETIFLICKSLGADHADSFVIPTGIIVTITHNEQVYTLVRRIRSRGIDLNKIDKINNLSRRIQSSHMNIDKFHKEIIKISNEDRYSSSITLISSTFAAGCFAIMFGGNFHDFISASLIGAFIELISMLCERLNINQFFINCLCGAVCASLAIIFMKLNLCSNLDKTIIGALMLLVPGLTITNAIRDTIAGDLIAGITKAAEAFLVAVSIAVGSGAILSLFIKNLGGF